MTKIKLKEDVVLFGNAKAFESVESLTLYICVCVKWKIHVFQKHLTTRHKQKTIHHMSTWSRPYSGQSGFVILSPLFRTMAKSVCMTISTSSHHIYIDTDAN